MTRAAPALAAAIAAAGLIGGCGGGPPSGGSAQGAAPGASGYEKVIPRVEGLGTERRLRELARMAEQEGGELSLYTSLPGDVQDAMVGAFEDAYDVDVAVYRADSEVVLRRLSEERRAGFRGADVVETSGPELFNLAREQILVDYEPSSSPSLVDGTDFDGWTATRFNKFVVSWNTDLVPGGQQPTSWADLADPRWDGKLTLELSDVEWFKTLFEWFREQGFSEAETQRVFEDMARGGTVTQGHAVIGELMAAGDVAVAASHYSYQVQQLADSGAPVAWRPVVEPIVSRPNGVGLVRGAQHPAAAVLFAEWLLSEDGQRTLAEQHLDVARRELATAKGVDEIRVDLPSLIESEDEWTDRYERLTRLGEQADGG